MGIIEDVNHTETPINIDELYAPSVKTSTSIPDATARNQAALTALLSADSGSIADTYRLLYKDYQKGGSEYTQSVEDSVKKEYTKSNNNIAVSILSDQSIPLEQKQTALNLIKNSIPSQAEIYSNKIAAKDQSGNEEQKYVITSSRQRLKDELEYKEKAQAIYNSTVASLDPSFLNLAGSAAEWFIPGGVTAQALGTVTEAQKSIGIDVKTLDKFILAKGKQNIKEKLESLSPQERIATLQTLATTIKNNSGIILRNKNDLEALTLLEQFVEGDNYGTGSQVIDSAVQLLDAIGIGSLAKQAVKKGGAILFPKNIQPVASPSPLSPFSLAVDSNPSEARKIYQIVSEAPSKDADQVSKALSGVSKEELILTTESPQILNESVKANLVNPSRKISAELKETVTEVGGTRFTEAERQLALDESKNKFLDATGVQTLDNYTQIGIDGDKVVIKGFFGNSEGGFLKAEDAIENAKFSFRNFEIGEDSLQVYKKDTNGEYLPISMKDAVGVEGNYIVGIEFKNTINPPTLNPLDVKRNWVDRLKFTQSRITGSVSSNLLDNASMLHPVITGSAERAVDLGTRIDKLLIKMGDDYARVVRSLAKDQQEALSRVIHDSNFNRIEYDVHTLKNAYGLSDESVNALTHWRNGWDTQHWLSNLTTIKNLRNNGFQVLEHNNARFYGKSIPKNSNLGKVYDPDLDAMRTLSQTELDNLYNSGGTLAKLKSPEVINGETVSHFITTNTPNNYLRVLSDSDTVLNYIPGYYKLYYNSPRFVVKNMKGANGEKFEQAIAVAGDWKEAENFLKRQAAAEGVPVEQFGRVRGDVKTYNMGDDMDWELSKTAGQVNQRHRGQLLQSSNSPVHLGSTSFILDPMESFIRSASYISKKVAMQDQIDIMKRRLLSQYKDILPKDGSYPNSFSDIGKLGDEFSKEASDARTLWAYIDQQENGFINIVDEGSKAMFRAISDAVGKQGLSRTEKITGWFGRQNLIKDLNDLTYQVLIKFNPLRQWVVQPIQALQLFAYNPKAFMRGIKDVPTYLTALMKTQMKQTLSKEESEIFNFIRNWGGLDGVDRQNLVDGPLRDLSRNSNKVLRTIGKVADIPAKVGFDPAERTNLLVHALTARQNAIGKGLDVFDKNVIDDILAETRALTLSMNSAGDVPYNKTSLSLLTRFLQIPHKGLTKITVNRRIPADKKLQIAAFDMLLYGVPLATFGEIIGKDLLSDDPKIREAQQFGLLTHTYNSVIKEITGIDPKINLKGLGPYETQGWEDLFLRFWESGFGGMVANTPSGKMFAGSNPKVTDAFKRASAWMAQNDYQGAPEDFKSVINNFAKITSGWDNYLKYRYMANTHKELNRYGQVLREDVSNLEALHQLFGLKTTTETASYAYMIKMAKDTKNHEEDITKAVKDIMQVYREKFDVEAADVDQTLRILQEFNRIFSDNPSDLAFAQKKFIQLAQDRENGVVSKFVKYAGIKGYEEHKQLLKASGMQEEQIQKFIGILKDAQTPDKEINQLFDKEGL